MLKRLFNIELDESVSDVQLDVQHSWIITLVVLAVLIAFAVYLYRSESWLSRARRMVMGGCYILAGALLLLLLLEPVLKMQSSRDLKRTLLVLVDTSQSMGIADERRDSNDVVEAAKVLNVPLPKGDESSGLGAIQKKVAETTRLDLAKAALSHPDMSPQDKLGEEYILRYYSMGDRLEPISGEGESTEWISSRTAEAGSSRIGSALDEVVARHAGQPLAGVVVLSDFAWLEGRDPVQAARNLKAQSVPVYTVPIGLPSPPDIEVQRVIAPEVAFTGDKVPVRVQFESSGFDEKIVELVFKVGDETVGSREVTLNGGTQFEKFEYVPDSQTGSVEISVSIQSALGETTDANNSVSHKMRVINEKIDVLYVEGMPRWEFRYLRWVLMRDPRLNVRFLMTQGDKHLAATSPRHIGAFPTKAEDLLKIDLVILGDVNAKYFKPDQISWMENLVKKSGGSLLMLAGRVGSPSSYTESKIADMLPVKVDNVRWRGVSSSVYPVVTAAGLESSVVSLGDTMESTNRIWSRVRPLGFIPELSGAKPGATTLLSLPKDVSDTVTYPLVAWQRYGNGKTMFVGTADLWRLRREVGDLHHARFWGQSIQFLALSRLLGQNKQITLETGRNQYGSGEYVEVYANVLTESFEPVEQPSYGVLMEKAGAEGLPTELELVPVLGSPGLYSGTILAGDEGEYKVSARSADTSIANTIEFDVKNIPLEERDTETRIEVAEQIASITGGKRLAASELGDLGELIKSENTLTATIQRQKDLWDIPVIFILLVILTGIEWFMRRRENLV